MMDLDDIIKLDRLYCTGEVSRAGWVVDQDAVIEAMDELEITLPVRIRYMTAKYRAGTQYTHKDKHHITVDQTHSLHYASDTLWHELAHCMQAERFAKETGKDIKFFDQEYRYQGFLRTRGKNIYEIEAEEVASSKRDFLLLAFAS